MIKKEKTDAENRWSAPRIWMGDPSKEDVYVEFKDRFSVLGRKGSVRLRVSCDSIFSVHINGKLSGFGNCSNMPNRCLYYTFDIGDTCREGMNDLLITVWHQGVDSQTYIARDAYLMYDVTASGHVLTQSSDRTQCRYHPHYVSGRKKLITSQMGLGYAYDFVQDEKPFWPADVLGRGEAEPTDIKNLELLPAPDVKRIETEQSLIFDMGSEVVGFLFFNIECEKETSLTVSYGEHLTDGHVPGNIHGRDFSASFRLKPGINSFENVFRRFAGRYLEIDTKDVQVHAIGLRPVVYPHKVRYPSFESEIDRRIYQASVKTLECCMHEHYEDCPWREQALYTMDSRNQMLCGYKAFDGTEFQIANLRLIAQSQREDGLLSICAPSGKDIPIPFFSLVFILQVYEYVKFTGDLSVKDEFKPVMDRILAAFEKNKKDGLIHRFPYPCWNFYEWSDASSNHSDLGRKPNDPFDDQADLIPNCMFLFVSALYDELFSGETDRKETMKAVRESFYDAETHLYKLSTAGKQFSQLGLAMALLAGLGDKTICQKMTESDSLIPATLSMRSFVYDALLARCAGQEGWILQDIRTRWGKMLDQGADTFWETELGAHDFGGAGSLCHGWSAIPAYYLTIMQKETTDKEN
ncbi:MAG: family 78 glycoside hydrolase catalytic domain [Clostridia bacterium]|nr:family 78 glycoside hydrolase catalytic domain [Clostridia bacterium]